MADIVNLRQARKARNRAADESRAEANRVKHGRSKADKQAAAVARQKYDTAMEGARRELRED
jgi:hypothetical protein